MLYRVWVAPRKETIRFECIQIQHDEPSAPLLPPDVIHKSPDNSCDGTARSTRYKDVPKARTEYNKLRLAKASVRRHRKFVFGAIYESIFSGYQEIDPKRSCRFLEFGVVKMTGPEYFYYYAKLLHLLNELLQFGAI